MLLIGSHGFRCFRRCVSKSAVVAVDQFWQEDENLVAGGNERGTVHPPWPAELTAGDGSPEWQEISRNLVDRNLDFEAHMSMKFGATIMIIGS